MTVKNKKKIINDPVYGFVNIPYDLVYDLIEHPYFQRLRRIKQLGLSHYVYPGAQHTRFQHVIGAMSLTHQAVETLRFKGVSISEQEGEAVCAAVLLHDLGHGPFSHTLEHCIVDVPHEEISNALMEELNKQFGGRLNLTLKIFNNNYKKKFLHQLVSSQLDMDRLDYLRRDSFYTGVQEGIIGHDRIIKMLTVTHEGELAVEEKGIYSIEKFIIARRLMYWQVYLHKTVIAAESLLIKIFERAKELAAEGVQLFCTYPLYFFFYENKKKYNFRKDRKQLEIFTLLDDYDIFACIKAWMLHADVVLATLCSNLINRQLPKIEFSRKAFGKSRLKKLQQQTANMLDISVAHAGYFVYTDKVQNKAYSLKGIKINIVDKQGKVRDIAKASDNYNISALSDTVVKHYLCFPKNS